MYLSYTEYQNMGGTLDETTYNRYGINASAHIDFHIFNRLDDDLDIPEKVKQLAYVLVELLRKKDEALSVGKSESGSNTSIRKQSNDGVSTEYSSMDSADLVKSADEEIENAIRFYLSGVKNSKGQILTYRGLYANE